MRSKQEILDALELIRISNLNCIRQAKKDPNPANQFQLVVNRSNMNMLEHVLGFNNDFSEWVAKYGTIMKKARAKRAL